MTVDTKKPPLKVKETKTEQPTNNGTHRAKDALASVLSAKPKSLSADVAETKPRNLKANILPIEGYVLEIDGKFKSQYETSGEASKAGLELKTKYPQIQVKIYDAKARTRMPVELTDISISSA